ncbi:hypothetical protein N7490_005724 [Penicillium lividum]|nr:hypothetical protein N7490_005724 [Penicillium lividum]
MSSAIYTPQGNRIPMLCSNSRKLPATQTHNNLPSLSHQPGAFKTSGADGIINGVLQAVSDAIAPFLATLYSARIDLAYFPAI